MNLAALMTSAARRAPFQGTIVFEDNAGAKATGTVASGVPASGSPADGFQAGAMIREKSRRLSVLPHGLAFPPKSGMYAQWEGRKWNVLAVSPLDPSGSGTPSLYRVTLVTP